MLGVAYGVEAKTNQAAMASIFKTAGASWLYGLVGPVLIGGLASLSRTKIGEGCRTRLDGMLGAGDGHDHRFGQGVSRWRAGMVSQRRRCARAREGAGGGKTGSRRRRKRTEPAGRQARGRDGRLDRGCEKALAGQGARCAGGTPEKRSRDAARGGGGAGETSQGSRAERGRSLSGKLWIPMHRGNGHGGRCS